MRKYDKIKFAFFNLFHVNLNWVKLVRIVIKNSFKFMSYSREFKNDLIFAQNYTDVIILPVLTLCAISYYVHLYKTQFIKFPRFPTNYYNAIIL